MAMAQERRRLSAEDWADAAMAVIGESGVAAVAVEPLAARLGATKGSFYWHFPNRDALLTAAVELWERRHTEGVIAQVEAAGGPEERLRRLFGLVLGSGAGPRLEVNLLAAAEHPLVGPAVRRVNRRRLEYTVGLFRELGFPAAEARRRGLMAFAVYVGQAQLAVGVPELLPDTADEQRAHLSSLLSILTS
jgi:AcrR family transcriptional regulator